MERRKFILDTLKTIPLILIAPNLFASFSKDDDIINEDDYDDQLYQIEMMKMLGQMNYDNNVVGWYQSSYCGAICTNDVILQQQQYQTSEDLAGNTVVLIYDPHQTKKGGLCIKAFRLSDKFK